MGGFDPLELDPTAGPIPPISGVRVVTGYKCNIGSCGRVYGSLYPLNKHQASIHSLSKRSHKTVQCQSLNSVKHLRKYVEVFLPSSESTTSRGIQPFLESADTCNLFVHSEVFDLASSAREKCAVFAQSHWDEMIQGVRIETLIKTADRSEHSTRPAFVLLRTIVIEYYKNMVPEISKLPLLVWRYMVTTDVK